MYSGGYNWGINVDRDLEYERLACEPLGLVHPVDQADCADIHLDLGHFQIIESEAAATAVIERYLWKLRTMVEQFQEGIAARIKADEPEYRAMQQLSKIQDQFLNCTDLQS